MRSVIACLIFLTLPVHAAERCTAKAVHAAPGLRVGQSFAVTEMKVNKATGQATYCSHGDECYPADALSFTTPCRIFTDPDIRQPDAWYFATN